MDTTKHLGFPEGKAGLEVCKGKSRGGLLGTEGCRPGKVQEGAGQYPQRVWARPVLVTGLGARQSVCGDRFCVLGP